MSDLILNYNKQSTSGTSFLICAKGKNINTKIENLDIYAKFATSSVNFYNSAIQISSGAITNIQGKINISTLGNYSTGFYVTSSILNVRSGAQLSINTQGSSSHGIMTTGTATTNILSNVILDINTSGTSGNGIYTHIGGTTNIYGGAVLNITTSGHEGNAINGYSNATINIQSEAAINILTLGSGVTAVRTSPQSICNMAGNICITMIGTNSTGIVTSGSQNHINIASTAQIYFNITGTEIQNSFHSASQSSNIIDIAAGAKLAFEKDGKTDWYEVKEDYEDENTSTTTDNKITADNVKNILNVEETSAWKLPEKEEVDFTDGNSSDETAKQDLADAGKNYQEIINQYDSLIKDANYKGINLLQTDKLTVKFNEDNTASLNVQGKDMSSQALGFTTFDWQTQGDIADSLAEIANALKSIRNYSAELGNNYSIITTRQDFTESLINVLTEGADKLTLADMNEESANMLALQTRQQLAINSLSLASQASQSILKLF